MSPYFAASSARNSEEKNGRMPFARICASYSRTSSWYAQIFTLFALLKVLEMRLKQNADHAMHMIQMNMIFETFLYNPKEIKQTIVRTSSYSGSSPTQFALNSHSIICKPNASDRAIQYFAFNDLNKAHLVSLILSLIHG